MLLRRKLPTNRKRHHAWLYAVVFTGRLSTLAILFLFISFLIQPFHQAMANEALPEPPPEEPPVAEDVREQVEEPAPAEEEPAPVEEVTAPAEETPTPEQTPAPDGGTGGGDGSDVPAEEPPVVDTPEIPDEVGSSTDDGSSDSDEEDGAGSDTEEDESTDEVEEEKEPKKDNVVEVQSLVTNENYFQFSRQSCVAVGDGAYHCTTKNSDGIDTQSVAYADRDEDGDMEIFLRTSKGKIKQITDNNSDDTAPHYDPESMRVVWQRLIDGRQQIVLFDIMEDKEAQLTFSRTNNMEPKVSDSGIVWQAWDGNDWEIMFFDGTYTEQITDNESQDVAPVVQDRYILWNVLGGEEQQARVYSLDTKEVVSIEGYEGGSIVNPRFVLVYDTEFENGDVITQTFDPATGLSEPVAAKPAPEPINIPQTDPTGEIRALIMNKSQKDENEVDDLGNSTPDAGSGTSTAPGTLNLKPADGSSTATAIITPAPEFTPIELTEYDLVIPQTAYEEAMQNASSTQE